MNEIESRRVLADPDCMNTEAIAFAMELLMPSKFLIPDLKKLGRIDIEDEPKIKKLAQRYGVSVQIMTVRIADLRLAKAEGQR